MSKMTRQEKQVQACKIPFLARKVVRSASFQVDEFKGTVLVNQLPSSLELDFRQE